MKLVETGFRPCFGQFAAFEVPPEVQKRIRPGKKVADCLLTWGYLDREGTPTLQVLCAGSRAGTLYHFEEEVQAGEPVWLKAREAAQFPYECFASQKAYFERRFSDMLARTREEVSEQLQQLRNMELLDESREADSFDVVRVELLCGNRGAEVCRVRLTGLGETWIEGVLLEEPSQDLGCHRGETLGVFLQDTQEGIRAFSDVTPK